MTSPNSHLRRIALLVDGDNVGVRHAQQIRARAQSLGRVDVCRVFANVALAESWAATPGYTAVHAGAGKNASDVLLAIQAVDLALASGIDTFVLATSDRDFVHLATYLREHGCHVLGLGEAKAPDAFRAACSEFYQLPSATAVNGDSCFFDREVRDAIVKLGDAHKGMRITELAQHMYRAHQVRISERPPGNWRGYLASRPDLYDIDPKGQTAMVRLRRPAVTNHG